MPGNGRVGRRLPVAELVLRPTHPHVHDLELARPARARELPRGRGRHQRARRSRAPRRRDDAVRARAEARSLAAMAGHGAAGSGAAPEAGTGAGNELPARRGRRLRRGRRRLEGGGRRRPNPPSDPDAAEESLAFADGSVLAWSGSELRAHDREVLSAFATQLALALQGRRLQAEAATATALAEGERTAHRAARRREPRPPDAARVDHARQRRVC